MEDERIVNGVNVDRLFETIDAIKDTPGLARCRFRAQNTWVSGGHNRTTITGFYGGCQKHTLPEPLVLESDEPAALLGQGADANPMDYVLTGLAACLTTSLVYYAAARGIQIDEVESRLEGDLDLHGFLGLAESVRNGFENVKVTIRIKAQVSDEKLAELCRVAQKHSPVFDIISRPVPVSVHLERESTDPALPARLDGGDSPASAGKQTQGRGSDGSPETDEL
jgi:uncharacterized OsmC-like protein